MEYTIQKLAKLAKISSRTLRYYDAMDLLKPARINSSGYRIYGQKEVDSLQQILFYRELGVNLNDIKQFMKNPHFDGLVALKDHRNQLLQKLAQIELLIENVNQTIEASERRIQMSDQAKFNGFKEQLIEDNEKKYGKEARQLYGNDAVIHSNQKLKDMTQQQYDEITHLSNEILSKLKEAYQTGDPKSPIAQELAALHKKWLLFYWKNYTKEAHVGIAQMYVDDERFTAYYDKVQVGAAAFLREAILIFTGINQ